MGPSKRYATACLYERPHDPPGFFGGGALSSFSPARVRSEPRRFKAANHSGMRDIKEGGFAAFLVIFNATPPPLSVWQTFRGTVA